MYNIDYGLKNNKSSWYQCKEACAADNKNMPCLKDMSAYNSLKSLGTKIIVGLYQPNHGSDPLWEWEDGCDSNFVLWAPNEPDNNGSDENCVVTRTDGFMDVPCDLANYKCYCSVECAAGEYFDASLTGDYCAPCPAGTYSTAGSNRCLDIMCPPGYWNSMIEGGTSATYGCQLCPTGQWSDGLTSDCLDTMCPPGYWNSMIEGGTSATDGCHLCPPGQWSEGLTSDTCKPNVDYIDKGKAMSWNECKSACAADYTYMPCIKDQFMHDRLKSLGKIAYIGLHQPLGGTDPLWEWNDGCDSDYKEFNSLDDIGMNSESGADCAFSWPNIGLGLNDLGCNITSGNYGSKLYCLCIDYCPAGYKFDSNSKDYCSLCPLGTYSTENSNMCLYINCPQNHWASKAGAISETDGCNKCPPGQWSIGLTSTTCKHVDFNVRHETLYLFLEKYTRFNVIIMTLIMLITIIFVSIYSVFCKYYCCDYQSDKNLSQVRDYDNYTIKELKKDEEDETNEIIIDIKDIAKENNVNSKNKKDKPKTNNTKNKKK
eukprot:Mrub_02621.p1 GENE.Mrub_02621~~Mrub_02621.p1  ORF type:complete len:541 (+),score=39.96 Mrub_02621:1-1623(+)